MNESRNGSNADLSPTSEAMTVPSAAPPFEQATLSHAGAAPTASAVGDPSAVPGYEILGELGRGGMGVVYKARHLKLGRVVALKMILAGGHAGAADLARFKTEAEAVARLQHPNIVQIFEVGEHGGLPFLSLEFCGGGSLDKKLAGTPLPPKEAAALVETLARAVQAAHDKGVVHRDLKPANVLLTEDSTPKITDFGLAKKLDADAGQTRTGAVMGTPSYMAPEQAGGKTAEMGPACDVYSLGAILYECLTGRPPFKAATTLETLQQVMADDPVPPRQLQPKTPRDLETVCLKCLEKQPGRRYGTAPELAEELRRFQAGEPVRARAVGTVERAAKWARRRPAMAAAYGLLMAALVLGLGGGGATWLWLRAESARGDAERARGEAIRARDDLKGALQRTETAEGAAEKARDDLQGALQREQDAKRQLTEYAYADRIYLAQHEWDAGHLERARKLLQEAGDLQEELTPGRRPWEWDYFNRLLHAEAAVLQGHAGQINSVSFSPDGRRVVTASADHTARVWDVASGKQLAVLAGHNWHVSSAVFSPDGTRIATAGGGDNWTRVWDAASYKPLAVLRGHNGWVNRVRFSPDGALIATASDDGTARLWDAASYKTLYVLSGHKGAVKAVSFSPDGSRVATASADTTTRIWDAASGKPVAVMEGHKMQVESMAFAPDGARIVTASQDGTVRLWDVASGKELRVMKHAAAYAVAFSPDGSRIASAGWDNTARLWDAASGQPLAVLEAHHSTVDAVAFSPDGGRVATGGADNTARLWDATTGRQLAVFQGHSNFVISVAFSPDGSHIATASTDGTARLWDATGDVQPLVIRDLSQEPGSLAFSPDGSHVLAASWSLFVNGGNGRLFDAVTGRRLAILGYGPPFAFRPDGTRIAAGTGSNSVALLDGATGKRLAVLQAQPAFAHIRGVAFSPDGSRIATVDENAQTVWLWDGDSGKQLCKLEGPGGMAQGLAFSPDGSRIITGGWDGKGRVWDAASGKLLLTLPTGLDPRLPTGHLASVAFSPNGGRIAMGGGDGMAWVWDAATGKQLAVMEGHEWFVNRVVFSPDGKRLATSSSDQTARLWDAESGKQIAVLQGHTDAVWSLVYSPDGSRIATASLDRTTRLWDAATGKPVAVLQAPAEMAGAPDRVAFVAFSPDGSRLATANGDRTARIWTAQESHADREKRRQFWQEEQAADAEKAGRWFAARFHLNLLLKDDPNNADLIRRRNEAETHLKAP